jgi:plastocyanin
VAPRRPPRASRDLSRLKLLLGHGGLVAALVLGAALAFVVAPADGAGQTVAIRDDGFSPATVTIHRGDVVTWTNRGERRHMIVSDDGKTMKSDALDPGAAFATLFEKAGTFRYHDPLAPRLRGTVVVLAGPLPTVTGVTPPSGTLPPGFTPQPPTITRPTTTVAAPPSGDGGRGGVGIVAAIVAAAVLAAGAFVLVGGRHRKSGKRPPAS